MVAGAGDRPRRACRPDGIGSSLRAWTLLVGSYLAAGTNRLVVVATLERPTAARTHRWNDPRPDQDRLHRDRPEDEIRKEWQPATHDLPIGCSFNHISPSTLRGSKKNCRISCCLWSAGRRYNRIRELARLRASYRGAGRPRRRRVAALLRALGSSPSLRSALGAKASPKARALASNACGGRRFRIARRGARGLRRERGAGLGATADYRRSRLRSAS